MITDEQFDELAQEAHFFGAMAAVFGSVAVFGYGAMWYGIGGILLFAAVKEFWYDRIHETP